MDPGTTQDVELAVLQLKRALSNSIEPLDQLSRSVRQAVAIADRLDSSSAGPSLRQMIDREQVLVVENGKKGLVPFDSAHALDASGLDVLFDMCCAAIMAVHDGTPRKRVDFGEKLHRADRITLTFLLEHPGARVGTESLQNAFPDENFGAAGQLQKSVCRIRKAIHEAIPNRTLILTDNGADSYTSLRRGAYFFNPDEVSYRLLRWATYEEIGAHALKNAG